MKNLRVMVFLVVLFVSFSGAVPAFAQCSVCSTNVETNAKSGGTTTKGLNNGIVYLLAAPYIAVAAIGFLWYKKYRRKNVELNMRASKIHLN
ncbi:hypothetical protein KXQ82_11125 [Mucilaginibacter sp. HMF5004]|uniref:hypothetical protein n=1 Tax=Mucilaginibacter rivuli TaxID=2857527 RepID=UPI001C5FCEB5|nr:hypothetical protein [Mucilaginibacter rivuli]MBW4890274.1 hypothetical protein [Mucilaginibacter rivuli]